MEHEEKGQAQNPSRYFPKRGFRLFLLAAFAGPLPVLFTLWGMMFILEAYQLMQNEAYNLTRDIADIFKGSLVIGAIIYTVGLFFSLPAAGLIGLYITWKGHITLWHLTLLVFVSTLMVNLLLDRIYPEPPGSVVGSTDSILPQTIIYFGISLICAIIIRGYALKKGMLPKPPPDAL